MSTETNDDTSQASYLAKRDARIEHLFMREGMEPRDITTAMLADGTLKSKTRESAERTVRAVVAKIRERIDTSRVEDAKPVVATNDVDAMERRLARLRWSHQKNVEIAEDESFITTNMLTPNGAVVIEKSKWPPGVRQKAAKDAAGIANQIAELEIALAAKRQTEVGVGEAAGDGGLTIIESDLTIPELIERNGIN